MDATQRFALVSSFYGPGAVVCWLLTAFSAILTWGFHPTLKKERSLGADFFAAALYPSVAAGHLLYQIIVFPGDRKIIFSTLDPTLLPRTAAIEAPLNVCETGSTLALALCALAAWHGVRRRFYLAVIGGLVIFSCYCFAFLQASDLKISASQLSRPYLFNVRPLSIAVLSMVGTAVSFLLLMLLALSFGVIRANAAAASQHEADLRGLRTQLTQANRLGDDDHVVRLEAQIAALDFAYDAARDAQVMWMSGYFSMLILPLSVSATVFTAIRPDPDAPRRHVEGWDWRLLYFIPRSNTSILELDQLVAVASGAITLLLSIRDAYKTWKAEQRRLITETTRLLLQNNRRRL